MSSPVRYVVRRQEYTPPTAAGVRRVLPEKWTAVATFVKVEDAYAESAKLTADARRTLNPFQLGGPSLFYQTSLPAFAFHDYLLDHGLTPPPSATSSNPNYVFWWVKHNRTFTDAQRAVVWQACDKLKLFEVVEEDDRQAAWLVVENLWLEQRRTQMIWGGEDQRYWVQVGERFHIKRGYPSRRDAERGKSKLADELREEMEDDGLLYFDMEGHSHDLSDAPLTSILSVPWIGDSSPLTAYVVTRGQFRGETTALPYGAIWEQFGHTGQLIPLVIGDIESAETTAADLCRRARRTANPFTLITGAFAGSQAVERAEDNRDAGDEEELPNGLTLEDAFATLRRLDTTPPPPEATELLADWYDQVVQWSPEFIDVIWGTFADFRLFEVIEVPFG